MKTQVKFRETTGKTIERIGGTECHEVLILLFTDGTFAAARAPHVGEDWEDFEISLEPHPAFGCHCLWWPAKLIELGIITAEEAKEAEVKATAETNRRREAEERENLKRLLEKYEPTIQLLKSADPYIPGHNDL